MTQVGHRFCKDVCITLTAIWLLSTSGCRQGADVSSSTPPQADSSVVVSSPALPELPENKMLVTSPGEGDFLIAENGTAKAVIVIPEEPSDKVRAAAEDLQAYLEKITGARLAIENDAADLSGKNGILVGPTKQTAAMGIEQPAGYPNKERVILKRDKNYVALLGNDDDPYEGTGYAVTMFLENLGCGWYGPQELWQVVPEYPTLAVGELDIEHTPQFRARFTQVYAQNPEVGCRWYLGGDKTSTGHGIQSLIPVDDYLESHPEWFALVDGKRDPLSHYGWQYDYSNLELVSEVAEKVIQKLDAEPRLTNYSIAANDGFEEGWCECEGCAVLGNPTDQILTFANRVAEIVSEKYPDKTISILSYHNSFFPPEKVKAHPNVEVMFCREASMTTPLDLDKAVLGKNDLTHNTYTQSWLGNFQEYIRNASLQHISIWEWYCVSAWDASWEYLPWVQGNVATRNQALWKRNGVEYVFYDQGPWSGYHETEESYPLRWPLWYVAAKGMWDGSLTGEQILYDSCRKLYGSAAEEMYDYYKALADTSEFCEAESICEIPCKPSEMYTVERVEIINAAIEAAKTKYDSVTEQQRQRMENQFEIWNKALFVIDSY